MRKMKRRRSSQAIYLAHIEAAEEILTAVEAGEDDEVGIAVAAVHAAIAQAAATALAIRSTYERN